MRAVLQRVVEASVTVDGAIVGQIGLGWLVLLGVGKDDTEADLSWLAEKTLQLRAFADESGKMNRSLVEVGGSVLVVSQFTLLADCRKGRRPSFVAAGRPADAERLYLAFAQRLREASVAVATGVFGAYMDVSLRNDGPVTFVLDSRIGS